MSLTNSAAEWSQRLFLTPGEVSEHVRLGPSPTCSRGLGVTLVLLLSCHAHAMCRPQVLAWQVSRAWLRSGTAAAGGLALCELLHWGTARIWSDSSILGLWTAGGANAYCPGPCHSSQCWGNGPPLCSGLHADACGSLQWSVVYYAVQGAGTGRLPRLGGGEGMGRRQLGRARCESSGPSIWDVGCGIQGLAKSELCGQANNCRRVVQLLRQAFQRAACRAREHGRESGVDIAAAAAAAG